MELSQVTLGAVLPEEEARFRALMGTHHYLGTAPKVRAWFSAHGHDDASLAIDGKTMKGAVDEAGRQVHILGACGHETAIPWGQKKPC